ncbi:MAG: transglutaminase domain-containing protein [Bacilli bacterium]|nr:transglutaminase domain-containing protein [Bacilli bacterium]
MSLGQKIIISVGAFVITFITVCTFFKSDIDFLLTSRTVERKYGTTAENSYFLEDHFDYVEPYEKAEVHSMKEIMNSIYYLINSGVTKSERYCAKDYKNCYTDMEAISSDTNMLSILNNYVHPFNSFDSIIFNFDDNIIKVEIKHTYTDEELKELNAKVDEIIKKTITNEMSTKDKIKAIHDYIINHTEYDTLKTKNINDTTYHSNTAYGVLIEGYGICSGYSDAMKLFLDKLNIINYKISNDQHIWNLVYLDGTWLHLDLTWDDPVSDKNITRDNYFLISTKTLKELNDDVHYYDANIFKEAKGES